MFNNNRPRNLYLHTFDFGVPGEAIAIRFWDFTGVAHVDDDDEVNGLDLIAFVMK